MPPADPNADLEEDYASEEDSDFAPEDAPANESSPSDDEEDANEDGEKSDRGKRKRSAPDAEADDAGLENSGDEAIIGKGKKRQKKSKAKEPGAGDNEDVADGPLVKTRSMRAAEKTERRMAAASGPVTIDVDALWAQMISEPTVPVPSATQEDRNDAAPASSQGDGVAASPQQKKQTQPTDGKAAGEQSEFIKIKRTYNFAGKVHTEEKVVARDSAEARLYLASLGDNADVVETVDPDAEPKRMPRKAFRSAFEPIPDQSSLRSDLNLGMSVRLRARELASEADAKKLNTVEKSRMDWAGYVDKEGIKDELELAGKSKHSFAARQDFLARSEARREDDARRVRLAGKT